MLDYSAIQDEKMTRILEQIPPARIGDTATYKIGLRSGSVYNVSTFRIDTIKAPEGERHQVTALIHNSGADDPSAQIRFMADQLEFVIDCKTDAVSPRRAGFIHAQMTNRVIDRIMDGSHEETIDALQQKAVTVLSQQPEWFVRLVNSHTERLSKKEDIPSDYDPETMKDLLSENPDKHDMPSAVLILLIDQAYHALESCYEPLISEEEWLDRSIRRVTG